MAASPRALVALGEPMLTGTLLVTQSILAILLEVYVARRAVVIPTADLLGAPTAWCSGATGMAIRTGAPLRMRNIQRRRSRHETEGGSRGEGQGDGEDAEHHLVYQSRARQSNLGSQHFSDSVTLTVSRLMIIRCRLLQLERYRSIITLNMCDIDSTGKLY